MEQADRATEERELAEQPEHELRELTGIYQARGLSPELAGQVAQALTAHNALGAHLRDELGITAHSATLVLLAVLGAVAARLGGAPMGRGAARVLFWGALAMGASALIGKLFGTGMVG